MSRTTRRRLLALIVVAAAGLAAGLGLAFGSSRSPEVARPLSASVQAHGFRIAVPRGFSIYAVRGGIYMPRPGKPPPLIGYVLTDFDLPGDTTIDSVLNTWGASGPPSNEVALEFELWQAIGPPPDERLHLPLTPDQPWLQEHPVNGTAVGYRLGSFRYRDEDYLVMYWVGPAAPSRDRAAVVEALKSLRPVRGRDVSQPVQSPAKRPAGPRGPTR